jgi:hypothetical protein
LGRFKTIRLVEGGSQESLSFVTEMPMAFYKDGSTHKRDSKEAIKSDANLVGRDKTQMVHFIAEESPAKEEVLDSQGSFGGVDVDKRSEKSGNSSKSSTLKKVTEYRERESQKKLWKLKCVFGFTMIILIALVTLALLYLTGEVKIYKTNLVNIRHGETRAFYIAAICHGVRTITLVNKQMLPVSYVDQAVQEIQHWNDLKAIQYSLYNNLSIHSETQKALYRIPQVKLYDFNQNLEIRNLKDATDLYIASAGRILQRNLSTVRETDDDVAFILNNAFGSLLNITEVSGMYYQLDYDDKVATLGINLYWIAVFPMVTLIVIFFFFLRPVIEDINMVKAQFMKVFLDIPKSVVKGLYENYVQRLEDLLHEDDLSDIENRHFNQVTTHEIEHKKSKKQRQKEKVKEHLSKTRSGKIIQRIIENAIDFFTHWWKHFKTQNGQHNVLFKVNVTVLITLAFFLSITFVAFSKIKESRIAAAEVYWSERRIHLIREVSYYFRESLISNDTAMTEQVLDRLAKLSRINHGLVYGNVEMMTASLFQPITPSDYKRNQFLFESVCGYTKKNLKECFEFAGGLYKFNAHVAILDYLETAYDLLGKNVTVLDVDYVEFEQMDMNYLKEGILDRVTENFFNSAEDELVWTEEVLLAMSLSFISLIVLVQLFVYRPLIKLLGDDIQRSRVMIFMIPPDVADKVTEKDKVKVD